jgi:hypothetical protein
MSPLLAIFDFIKPCPDIIMTGFFAFTHLLFETFFSIVGEVFFYEFFILF